MSRKRLSSPYPRAPGGFRPTMGRLARLAAASAAAVAAGAWHATSSEVLGEHCRLPETLPPITITSRTSCYPNTFPSRHALPVFQKSSRHFTPIPSLATPLLFHNIQRNNCERVSLLNHCDHWDLPHVATLAPAPKTRIVTSRISIAPVANIRNATCCVALCSAKAPWRRSRSVLSKHLQDLINKYKRCAQTYQDDIRIIFAM